MGKSNFQKRILVAAVENFVSNIKCFLPKHSVTHTDIFTDSHELQLVKFFTSYYCNLKIHTECKNLTLRHLGHRATYGKNYIILFYSLMCSD